MGLRVASGFWRSSTSRRARPIATTSVGIASADGFRHSRRHRHMRAQLVERFLAVDVKSKGQRAGAFPLRDFLTDSYRDHVVGVDDATHVAHVRTGPG